MGIAKEDGTLEASKQIIDTDVPSLAVGELPVTILPDKIDTPDKTPVVQISSRVRFQTKLDYIPSISDNQYETVDTQGECEETFHLDAHICFCQELIEEMPEAAAVIMT